MIENKIVSRQWVYNNIFEFSDNDIASCNYLDVPFYLVEPETQSIIHIEPQET